MKIQVLINAAHDWPKDLADGSDLELEIEEAISHVCGLHEIVVEVEVKHV